MSENEKNILEIENKTPRQGNSNPGFFRKAYNKFGLLATISIGLAFLILFGIILSVIFGEAVGGLSIVSVGGGITAIFFCGIIAVLRRTGIFQFVLKLKKHDLIFIIIFSLFIIIFYCVFMSMESYVYYWDYGSYWSGTIIGALDIIDYLFRYPLFTIVTAIGSINVSDYNSIISIIMAFPLFLTGSSYFAYYLLVVLMFYLPALFIFSCTVFTLLGRGGKTNLPFGLHYGMAALVGAGLIPILCGYVDAFCLLPAAIFLALLFKNRFTEKNRGDSIAAGCMLILTAVGRRYFLYLVVGLTAAVLLVSAAYFLAAGYRKSIKPGAFNGFAVNMLIIAATCLLLLGTVCIGYTIMAVFNNYGFSYSAYQNGGLIYNYKQLFYYYGWVICGFAAVGIVFLLLRRKYFETGFMLVTLAVTSFLFYLVQSMGVQHYYTVFFPIIFFCVSGIDGLYGLITKPDKKALKATGTVAITAVMVTNFLFSTIFGSTTFGQALSGSSVTPKVRNDIETLMKLTDDLYNLTVDTSDKIYILGSGAVMNEDIMRKLYMPEKSKIADRLSITAHVDLRDGFKRSFLSANIVVTSSPCEYHLGESNQRVVSILNNAIIGDSPLNDNFEEKTSYTLDYGIIATIWQKTSAFDNADYEYLIGKFNEYYSEYPSLFANRIKN